ncbi:MAG: hypothetical protein ACRC80_14920 [Waterburya sp.]
MSTTFEILPTVQSIPKFSDVLNLSNKRLQKYAKLYGVEITYDIAVEIIEYENDKTINFNSNDLAQ